MITAGVDVGSKTVKIVILKDGTIVGKGMATAGLEAQGAWDEAWDAALKEAGVSRDDIENTIGTGSRLREIEGDHVRVTPADSRAKIDQRQWRPRRLFLLVTLRILVV